MQITVTRSNFIQAIETAIEAANPPEDATEALRVVARTAEQVGVTFDACPLTKAGHYRLGSVYGTWRGRFVSAYDNAMIEANSEYVRLDGPRDVVVIES